MSFSIPGSLIKKLTQPSSSSPSLGSISRTSTRSLRSSTYILHQSPSTIYPAQSIRRSINHASYRFSHSQPLTHHQIPTSYTPPAATSSARLSTPEDSQVTRESTSSAPTLQQQSPTKVPASQVKKISRANKPTKQVINLTPRAIDHLSTLLVGPNPKLIRIGVKNKGCAGMAYNLDYVDQPGKFDEVVVTKNQTGQEIKVLIDSRALFSIIGSTMDWQESKLGNKFVFDNPNIKEECGCGESFLV